MNTSICSRSSMNSTPLPILNDPGYSVYLIYQKEVYNCDHAFLQSLMDWIYTSNDSPYKFIFRNRAFININHYGICLSREKNGLNQQSTSSTTSTTENSSENTNPPGWTNIHFNLKHLKEIYVDKRHKDTCVLVSKVSSSSANNIYVWKKTNPSNYQTFRSPYALNNAYKKSYLLTIIKFKDGPTRLLQSIQLLDRILADYNRQDSLSSKKHNSTSDINNLCAISNQNKSKLSISDLEKFYDSGRCQITNKQQMGCNANNNKQFNSIGHSASKANQRLKPNIQQYFNDYLTRKLLGGCNSASSIVQSSFQQPQKQTYSSSSSTNIINNNCTQAGHSSLKNGHNNCINNIMIRHPRRLSVDNSNIFLNNNTKLNNSLYSSSVNNSNISLQSFCNNCSHKNNNINTITTSNIQHSSYSLSRHSSINEIASSIHYHNQVQHFHHFNYHTQQLPQHSLNNPNRVANIVKTNSINGTLGINFNRNHFQQQHNNVSCSVPASPAPRNTSSNGNFIAQKNITPTQSFQAPCQNCHNYNCYYNSNINNNNKSIDNKSEINYQQHNRKLINITNNNNDNSNNNNNNNNNNLRYSVSSTSSLNQTIDLNKSLNSHQLPPKSKTINEKFYLSSTTPATSSSVCVSHPQIQQVNLLSHPKQAETVHNQDNKTIIAKPTVKRHSSITSTTKPSLLLCNDLKNQSTSNILVEVKNNLNKVNKNELDKMIEKIQVDSTSTATNSEKTSSVIGCSSLIRNSIFTLNKNQDCRKSAKCIHNDKNDKISSSSIKNSPINNLNESSNITTIKECNNKVRDIINTFNNFNNNLSNPSRTSAFTSTITSNNISNNSNEENPSEKNINKSTINENVKTKIDGSNLNLNSTLNTSLNKNVNGVCQTVTNIIPNNVESQTLIKVKNCISNWNNNAGQIQNNNSEENQKKCLSEPVKSQSKINKITEKLNQEINKNISAVDQPTNNNINLKSRNSINLGSLQNKDNENVSKISNKTSLVRGAMPNNTKTKEESNPSSKSSTKEPASIKVVETIIQNLKSTSTSFDASTPKSTIQPITKNSVNRTKNGEKTSTRKRTFANMNWSIDPEEEKILRSSSPYIVPEVIVQRNEGVKSILKKNNFTSLSDITNPNNDQTVFNENKEIDINSATITIPEANNISPKNSLNTSSNNINNMASPFSNKKRVDFRENFCMVNFFDSNKNLEEDSEHSFKKNQNGKVVGILNKPDCEPSSSVAQESSKSCQVEAGPDRKIISNNSE